MCLFAIAGAPVLGGGGHPESLGTSTERAITPLIDARSRATGHRYI